MVSAAILQEVYIVIVHVHDQVSNRHLFNPTRVLLCLVVEIYTRIYQKRPCLHWPIPLIPPAKLMYLTIYFSISALILSIG